MVNLGSERVDELSLVTCLKKYLNEKNFDQLPEFINFFYHNLPCHNLHSSSIMVIVVWPVSPMITLLINVPEIIARVK